MHGPRTHVGRETAVAFALLLLSLPAWAQEAPERAYAPLPDYRVYGEPGAEGDGEAIRDLMETFARAWGRQDVEGVVAAYAPDAEWTNAFGEVRRGRDELRRQFAHLFARFESGSDNDGGEEAGSDAEGGGSEPRMSRGPISLRYLGSDAAVVHSFVESDWGRNRDGAGTRRVYQTYVLQKRGEKWLIAHHMIMDARR